VDILRGGILKIDVSKVFNKSDEYFYEGMLKKESFNIENIEILQDVKIVLKLREIEKEVFLEGKFDVKIKCQCVKCLKDIEEFISDEFQVMYLPLKIYEEYEENYKGEHEYDYKEIIREKLEDDTFIDINKLIEEYIIVAVPEYPKCSTECEGVNEIMQYENNEIDPRWQQLLNIVKEK